MCLIRCKQLSIYQRQRPSVVLVTASKPTPSYHVTEQNLMGQICVIINEVWLHSGLGHEFSPLMMMMISSLL